MCSKVADELRVEFQRAKIAEAITVGQVGDRRPCRLRRNRGNRLPEQIALGLLVGLMLGAAGAFLAERFGSTIAQRVQVEQLGHVRARGDNPFGPGTLRRRA